MAEEIMAAPGKVADELRRLWRDAIGQHGDAEVQTEPHLRVCLANVLVAASGDGDASEEFVRGLSGCIPARYFMLRPSAQAAQALITKVSLSECSAGQPGPYPAYAETIVIEFSAETAPAVPSLILSLLLPDVVTLAVTGGLWQKPAERDCLLELLPFCERVLFDSSGFPNLQPDIAWLVLSLSELNARAGIEADVPEQRVVAHDYVWERLKGWRSILVEQFNVDREGFCAQRSKVGFTVEYSPGGGPSAVTWPAVLLASWLLVSLCESEQGFSVSKQSGKLALSGRLHSGESCEVLLSPASAPLTSAPDSVNGVGFTIECGNDSLMTLVRRVTSDGHEVLRITSGSCRDGNSANPDSCTYDVRHVPVPGNITPRQFLLDGISGASLEKVETQIRELASELLERL